MISTRRPKRKYEVCESENMNYMTFLINNNTICYSVRLGVPLINLDWVKGMVRDQKCFGNIISFFGTISSHKNFQDPMTILGEKFVWWVGGLEGNFWNWTKLNK